MSKKPRRMANKNENKEIKRQYTEDKEINLYGTYERNKERQEIYKTKKMKGHRGRKILLIALLIIVIIISAIIASGYVFINGKLGKMQQENIDKNQIGINTTVADSLRGYRNIALLGIDSRADNYSLGNRSDCIIIASINKTTKDVNLISVYRDTYMQVEEKGIERLDKVTHAYSYGGAQNALKALNTNLDLDITDFITVNFDAVIAAVDALGGIPINIESEEIKYVNECISELISTSGKLSKTITREATQNLDGIQALAYARVRSTAGGDYKRTERMRTVIEEMAKKAKTLSPTKLNTFLDTVLPRISTNISSNEIIGMIPTVASFNISKSLGWPYNVEGITLDRWYGVPCTLETNVVRLHKEMFGQTDYVTTEKVKSISTQIIKKTGYTSKNN